MITFITLISAITVCAVVVVLYLAVILLDWLHAFRTRRMEFVSRWTDPLVFAAMDTDTLDATVASLPGLAGRAVETRMVDLIGKVKGADRDRLSHLLKARGWLDSTVTELKAARAETRVRAAAQLGRAVHDEAVPALHGAVDDSDPAVRSAAISALGRIGTTRALTAIMAAAIQSPAADRACIVLALVRHGRRALPQARMLADAPTREARIIGLTLLGLHGDDDRLSVIHEALWSTDPGIAEAAADALVRIASPHSVPTLLAYGERGPLAAIRCRCAEALGLIGDQSTVDKLAQWSDSNDRAFVASVLQALGNLGQRGVAALHRFADANQHDRGGLLAAVGTTPILSGALHA